jgi:hypothetical protein
VARAGDPRTPVTAAGQKTHRRNSEFGGAEGPGAVSLSALMDINTCSRRHRFVHRVNSLNRNTRSIPISTDKAVGT